METRPPEDPPDAPVAASDDDTPTPSMVERVDRAWTERPPDPPPALAGVWTAARAVELLALARGWAMARHDITLDCSRLERLDVATLQILLALRRELSIDGFAFTLAGVPSPIAKVISLGGLEGELLACP